MTTLEQVRERAENDAKTYGYYLTSVKEILQSLLVLATAEEVASALEKEMRQRYPQVFADRLL